MARRRERRHEHEEHGNHERWLITYADMVTLLMVLFIVMFAMSTVDEKKYHELKSGLANGFGRSTAILNGSAATQEDRGPTQPGHASYEMLVQDLPESQRTVVTEVLEVENRLRVERQYAEARNELDRLLEIWRRIEEALRAEGLRSDVRAEVDERGLVVSLVSRHVVFEPNVAELAARGTRIVDTIAPVLAGLTEPIEIDGHTNQVPVKPKYYPTDWELSVARAVHVLRRLDEVNGLPAARLRATGYGHTKPLVDPDRPGSQRVNKRVDLVVLSQAPAATRERLAELFEQRGGPPSDRDAAPHDPSDPTVSARSDIRQEELP